MILFTAPLTYLQNEAPLLAGGLVAAYYQLQIFVSHDLLRCCSDTYSTSIAIVQPSMNPASCIVLLAHTSGPSQVPV